MDNNILRNLYIAMLRIRKAQERIADIYPRVPRRIQCPVHLYIGHEAIAAGVCANLFPDDYVFSYYRGHGHYLAKGGDLRMLFAELYGKRTGCSGGHGGSMHLVDIKRGFMGTSAIVGGSIPMAVGAAFAFKMRKESRIVVSFFGDGACEEGVWHESINFAALRALPIIFVCENNFYAVKSHLSARQPKDNIYKRAKYYGMPGIRVNGNSVLEVFRASLKAAERARRGDGPTLIEARTYRWRQHVENTYFNADILEGRSEEEFATWIKRCPVKTYERILLRRGIITKSGIDIMAGKIDKEINKAIRFAEESSFPDICKLEE